MDQYLLLLLAAVAYEQPDHEITLSRAALEAVDPSFSVTLEAADGGGIVVRARPGRAGADDADPA